MPGRSEARLPSYPMPFIGREDEIAAIANRLGDPHCRLLTLVGPGGIGKTRLAIEVAQRISDVAASVGMNAPSFASGIRLVDLQPVTTREILIATIANALGVLLSGPEDPREQLLNYLSDHHMLLLLDNFEQLLDSVDLLADVLNIAPGVKLLVTSREALNMQEEWLWRVAGLQVPGNQTGMSILSSSAVQLFAERARRTRQDFTLVGQETPVTRICQLVNGMPLALELAAGWTKALTCAEIADEIQRSLDILTTNLRNAPERHRSMQAVFDHSWRLLTEDERVVFPRLSVFRGGFRREAAEQVAGASLVVLAGLVDKSFLWLSAAGRYEIHELTRQYAEEQLSALPAAQEETQYRHCAYYADFLHQRQVTLRGSAQAAALDEIGDELANVRVSWAWAVEHSLLHEIHLSMHSLYLFCHIRAQAVEGERLFNLAVGRFEQEDSATLAYLLLARCYLGNFNGRRTGIDQYPRAIRLAYEFWTTDEIAVPLRVYAIINDDLIRDHLFDDPRQEQVCRDFLQIFREHDQPWGASFMLYCLGELYQKRQQLDEAERYYHQGMDDFLRLGDRWGACWSSMGLAIVFEKSGRYREALQMWEQHQDVVAAVRDFGGVVFALSNKARVAWKRQDLQAARFYVAQAIQAHLEIGSQFAHLYVLLNGLITLFMSEAQDERAAELSSFVRQHADTARAAKMIDVFEQNLVTLAQRLPAERYRQALERGKTLHLRTILEQLLDELSEYSPPSALIPQADSLTERELEVLRLVGAGHSNREIARELFLTLNTVKSHIHHLYGKLGVESRTQAIARARELNLL